MYTITVLDQNFKEIATAELNISQFAEVEYPQHRVVTLNRIIAGPASLRLELIVCARKLKGKAGTVDDDTDSVASSIPTSISSLDAHERAKTLEQDLDGFTDIPDDHSQRFRALADAPGIFSKTSRQTPPPPAASLLSSPLSSPPQSPPFARPGAIENHEDASCISIPAAIELSADAMEYEGERGLEQRIGATRAANQESSNQPRIHTLPQGGDYHINVGSGETLTNHRSNSPTEGHGFSVNAQTAAALAASAVVDARDRIDDLSTMTDELSSLGKALLNFSLPDDPIEVDEYDSSVMYRSPSLSSAVSSPPPPPASPHSRISSSGHPSLAIAPLDGARISSSSLTSDLEIPSSSPTLAAGEYVKYEDHEEDPALLRARAMIKFSKAQEQLRQPPPAPPLMAAPPTDEAALNEERRRAEAAEEKAAAAAERAAASASELAAVAAERELLRKRVERAETATAAAQAELHALRAQLSTTSDGREVSGPVSTLEVSSRLATAKAAKAAKAAEMANSDFTTQLIGAKMAAAQFAFERDEARAQLKRIQARAGRKRNVPSKFP